MAHRYSDAAALRDQLAPLEAGARAAAEESSDESEPRFALGEVRAAWPGHMQGQLAGAHAAGAAPARPARRGKSGSLSMPAAKGIGGCALHVLAFQRVGASQLQPGLLCPVNVQVVVHATKGYRAVVCGWDFRCCESPEWQEAAGVRCSRGGLGRGCGRCCCWRL